MTDKNKGSISIETHIPESEQASSLQNGALHSGPPNLAVTIDAQARFPEGMTSQEEAKDYLEHVLKDLVDKGWVFNIAIGPDTDHE